MDTHKSIRLSPKQNHRLETQISIRPCNSPCTFRTGLRTLRFTPSGCEGYSVFAGNQPPGCTPSPVHSVAVFQGLVYTGLDQGLFKLQDKFGWGVTMDSLKPLKCRIRYSSKWIGHATNVTKPNLTTDLLALRISKRWIHDVHGFCLTECSASIHVLPLEPIPCHNNIGSRSQHRQTRV